MSALFVIEILIEVEVFNWWSTNRYGSLDSSRYATSNQRC